MAGGSSPSKLVLRHNLSVCYHNSQRATTTFLVSAITSSLLASAFSFRPQSVASSDSDLHMPGVIQVLPSSAESAAHLRAHGGRCTSSRNLCCWIVLIAVGRRLPAGVFGALRGGRHLIWVCCQAGYLTSNPFETETSDILSVNGTQYSGLGMSRGPVGLSVAANTAVEPTGDLQPTPVKMAPATAAC